MPGHPYSHLESLFLFQLLSQYGFGNGAFHRISEDLKRNALVRGQERYDAKNVTRLSPESLQDFSLQLLRDEQRLDAEATSKNGSPGLSPTSRKRKLPNSLLPSLKEVQEHSDKLPLLVDRLYVRYRDDVVRQIRRDEQTIDDLQREIIELEREERQHKTAPQQISRATTAVNGTPVLGESTPVKPNGQIAESPALSTPQISHAVKPTAHAPQSVQNRKTAPPTLSPVPPHVRAPSEGRYGPPAARASEQNRPSNGNTPVLQHPQAAPSYVARPGSAPPPLPLAETAQRPENIVKSQSPVPRQSPQPQAPTNLKWEPPYRPQQQTSVPSPRPPYTPQNVRAPLYPNQPQAGHPQYQQPPNYMGNRHHSQPHPQPSRTPTSGVSQPSHPVLVPPQNAGQIPLSLPSLPLHVAPDGSGQQAQQHRPPSAPTTGPLTTPIPAPQSSPHFANQHQQYYRGSQDIVRPPMATPHVANYANHSNHRHASNGPTLPTQRPNLPGPAHPQQGQMPPSVPVTPVTQQTESSQKSYSSPYNEHAQRAGPPVGAQRPQVAIPHPVVTVPTLTQPPSVPQTPTATNLSAHVIRGHGTKWTSTPTPGTPRMETGSYFESPAFEPISPPQWPTQLPPKTSPHSSKKETRKPIQKIDTSASNTKSRLSISAQKAAPAAPQTNQESNEDQDVPGRKIKDEVATPKALEDIGAAPADDNVHSDKTQLEVTQKTATKRKREDTPETDVPLDPSAPATHVLWTRGFNKISGTAVDQVTSHRHANMFAGPVKSRDAPGYHDIVLRPQDLKGIRAAINHGHKAAVAADKIHPASDPNASSVSLPISIDLVPPKGIVNIEQLERELVHMFANATMYAPDPERGIGSSFMEKNDSADEDGDAIGYEVDENGIVKDTISMFLDVENNVNELRHQVARKSGAAVPTPSRSMSVAAGESTTVEEVDDQVGDTDAPSAAKRRRVRG